MDLKLAKYNLYTKLQEIESSKKILSFKYQFKSYPMYLFVRLLLIKSLEDIIKKQSVMSFQITFKKMLKRPSLINKILFLLKIIFKNALLSNPKDIIILDCMSYSRFGNFFNNDNSIMMGSIFGGQADLHSSKNGIRYLDFVGLLAKIAAKFISANKDDTRNINDILKFIKDEFSINNDDIEAMRNKLIYYSKTLKIYDYFYTKLLKKINPKLILHENSMGLHRMIFVKAAQDMDIPVAEYQHGAVDAQHMYYNVGSALLDEKMENYFPKYFLSFGEYWEKDINMPKEKITIGNPYLEEQSKKYPKNKEKTLNILILTDIGIPKIKWAIKKIENELSDVEYKIIIRAHPSERSIQEDVLNHLLNDKVQLCNINNPYKRLSATDIVIGAQSTVRHEALIYKCKVWYVQNDLASYCDLFENFDDSTNTKELLSKQPKNADRSYIFAPNWQENYKNFLDKFGTGMTS